MCRPCSLLTYNSQRALLTLVILAICKMHLWCVLACYMIFLLMSFTWLSVVALAVTNLGLKSSEVFPCRPHIIFIYSFFPLHKWTLHDFQLLWEEKKFRNSKKVPQCVLEICDYTWTYLTCCIIFLCHFITFYYGNIFVLLY